MILGYRIVTFLLAGGYFVEMITRQGLHMFHYLTIWGLSASLICAGMMLYHTLVAETRRFNFFSATTFCLNIVIMVLYWKLYFKDPHLLYADEPQLPWYRDDYLHLLGPILQCIDSLFIYSAFRMQKVAALVVYYIASISYMVLGETLFHLPYPFMTHFTFYERVLFYQKGFIIGTIAFFVAVFISNIMENKSVSPLLRSA